MKTYYFNLDGSVNTDKETAGEDLVKQNLVIKAEAPESIESWRLSYDFIKKQVVIFAEGKTEEEAMLENERLNKLEIENNNKRDSERDISFRKAEAIKRLKREELLKNLK